MLPGPEAAAVLAGKGHVLDGDPPHEILYQVATRQFRGLLLVHPADTDDENGGGNAQLLQDLQCPQLLSGDVAAVDDDALFRVEGVEGEDHAHPRFLQLPGKAAIRRDSQAVAVHGHGAEGTVVAEAQQVEESGMECRLAAGDVDELRLPDRGFQVAEDRRHLFRWSCSRPGRGGCR